MGVLAQAYPGRSIPDDNLTTTKALPAAGASATSTAFDTGDNTTGIFPEGVALELSCGSTANLPSAQTITYTVLADTANPPTTALSPSLTFVTTGTAGNGAATGSIKWRVPYNAGRYLAIQATIGANGGNNTATSFQVRLLGAGTDSN